MRTIESRLQKLEQVTQRPIAFVWLDRQNETELRAQIAERQAKGRPRSRQRRRLDSFGPPNTRGRRRSAANPKLNAASRRRPDCKRQMAGSSGGRGGLLRLKSSKQAKEPYGSSCKRWKTNPVKLTANDGNEKR
jgi:hypothetical protein